MAIPQPCAICPPPGFQLASALPLPAAATTIVVSTTADDVAIPAMARLVKR